MHSKHFNFKNTFQNCSLEKSISKLLFQKFTSKLLPQKIYFKTIISKIHFKIALSKNACQNYYLSSIVIEGTRTDSFFSQILKSQKNKKQTNTKPIFNKPKLFNYYEIFNF